MARVEPREFFAVQVWVSSSEVVQGTNTRRASPNALEKRRLVVCWKTTQKGPFFRVSLPPGKTLERGAKAQKGAFPNRSRAAGQRLGHGEENPTETKRMGLELLARADDFSPSMGASTND